MKTRGQQNSKDLYLGECEIHTSCLKELRSAFSSCLVKDIEQRPFCRDLLNHSFICQMDDTSLVSKRLSPRELLCNINGIHFSYK